MSNTKRKEKKSDSTGSVKRWLKRVVWVVGALLVLIILAGLFSQTSYFKRWVADRIEAAAASSLNGRLEIGELDGTLMTTVTLKQVRLVQEADTLATVQSIGLEYNLLAILFGDIHIELVTVDSPHVYLSRNSPGVWNVARLVRADTTADSTTAESTDGFGYTVMLDAFQLRGGSITVLNSPDAIPASVRDIDIVLSGVYDNERQWLELAELNFVSEEPPLDLERLAFRIERTEDSVSVRDMELRTARNKLVGMAEYTPADTLVSDVQLRSQPLEFDEFTFVLPFVSIAASPVIDLSASLIQDSFSVHVSLVDSNQAIEMDVGISDFSQIFDTLLGHSPRYHLTIGFTDLVPGDWLAQVPIDLQLSGQLTVAGQGFTPENAVATVDASFRDCILERRSIEQIELDARYDRGNALCTLVVDAPAGGARLTGAISHVPDRPHIVVQGDVKDLDIAEALLDDALRSSITAHIDLELTGLELTTMRGKGVVAMTESSFRDIEVDTLASEFEFESGLLRVDTLLLSTDLATLHGRGSLDTTMNFDAGLSIELGNLQRAAELFQISALAGTGTISGTVSGTTDSVACNITLDCDNIVYSDYEVARLNANASGDIGPDLLDLSGKMTAESIDLARLNLQKLVTEFAVSTSSADLRSNITQSDSIKIKSDLTVAWDSTIDVSLRELEMDLRGHAWTLTDTSSIMIGEAVYRIDSLKLVGPRGDDDIKQELLIDGVIDLDSSADFRLQLAGIDLSAAGSFLELPPPVDGRLSVDLNLSGTVDRPVLAGEVVIRDGRYAEFHYDSLYGGVDYRGDSLTVHFSLSPNEAGQLHVSGTTTVSLALVNLDNLELSALPITASVAADSLSLQVLRAIGKEVSEVNGYVVGRCDIAGTPAAPRFNGQLALREGGVEVPAYGIAYKSVVAVLTFEGDSVSLDTLHIVRSDGSLTATGKVTFQDNILSGLIQSTQIGFDSDEFFVVRHDDYEIQISGHAGLEGSIEKPTYSGEIRVDRSRIFLPALTNGGGDDADKTQGVPLLAAATQPDTATGDSIPVARQKETEPAGEPSEFYENLRGRMKVKLPRNTWVRRPGLLLELEGEIDVVKDGQDIQLFGTIDVVRGHYELYGRRFELEEGSLRFQGDPEINPKVNIEAKYVFRAANRDKRSLTLFVAGTATTPSVSFQLDGQDIPEGDALCYLAFGRSCDRLSSGQRAEAASVSEGDLARKVAASLLSKQLTSTIGDQLNLDVVEIEAQESFEAATLVVGKYLTNDLLVTYERGIGSFEDDDIAREQLNIEYQVTNFLFLRFTEGDSKESGLDVIIKWEEE